jgi:hypothetical protein
MKKLIVFISGLFMSAFLFAGNLPERVECYDNDRMFVIEELSKHYGLEMAYRAESLMHAMMSKRGMTSLDMLAAMWIECRLDYTQANRITGAFGIIQFMPKTCRELGLSYRYVTTLGLLAQLRLADVYFRFAEKMSSNRMSRTEDLYCSILAPARVGQDTLYKYGTKAYRYNKCLNMVHGDGGLTIEDIRLYLYSVVPYRKRLTILNWSRVKTSPYTVATDIRLDINPCRYIPSYKVTEFMHYPVVDRLINGTGFA